MIDKWYYYSEEIDIKSYNYAPVYYIFKLTSEGKLIYLEEYDEFPENDNSGEYHIKKDTISLLWPGRDEWIKVKYKVEGEKVTLYNIDTKHSLVLKPCNNPDYFLFGRWERDNESIEFRSDYLFHSRNSNLPYETDYKIKGDNVIIGRKKFTYSLSKDKMTLELNKSSEKLIYQRGDKR